MKVIITENQVKKLMDRIILEYDEGPISRLSNFFGLNNTNTTNTSTQQFASDIPNDNELMHPLGKKAKISSNFGNRNLSVGSKNHHGIDISTPSGSPVYAPKDGTIIDAKDTTPNGCGGFIQIDHGDIQTKFCHLKQWVINRGDTVKKGQLIGYSGGGKSDQYRGTSTGSHLHYEILNSSGIAMNPTSVQHNLV